jgi:hypothetical protein
MQIYELVVDGKGLRMKKPHRVRLRTASRKLQLTEAAIHMMVVDKIPCGPRGVP